MPAIMGRGNEYGTLKQHQKMKQNANGFRFVDREKESEIMHDKASIILPTELRPLQQLAKGKSSFDRSCCRCQSVRLVSFLTLKVCNTFVLYFQYIPHHLILGRYCLCFCGCLFVFSCSLSISFMREHTHIHAIVVSFFCCSLFFKFISIKLASQFY